MEAIRDRAVPPSPERVAEICSSARCGPALCAAEDTALARMAEFVRTATAGELGLSLDVLS